jgi:hypothetical protein
MNIIALNEHCILQGARGLPGVRGLMVRIFFCFSTIRKTHDITVYSKNVLPVLIHGVRVLHLTFSKIL